MPITELRMGLRRARQAGEALRNHNRNRGVILEGTEIDEETPHVRGSFLSKERRREIKG